MNLKQHLKRTNKRRLLETNLYLSHQYLNSKRMLRCKKKRRMRALRQKEHASLANGKELFSKILLKWLRTHKSSKDLSAGLISLFAL
jgi:hypothetical protein